MADWTCLPEVVLGKVFSYSEILDKFCISKTCRSWECAAFRPDAWANVCISGEKLLLQITCNMMCLDETISEQKLSSELLFFVQKGSNLIKNLNVTFCRPFDIELFKQLTSDCQNLTSLQLSIGCNTEEKLDMMIHDCKLTAESPFLDGDVIPRLNVSNSKYPTVPFGTSHAQHLKELWIVNSFLKVHFLRNILYLVNLTELAINPQQLDHSLLVHLASNSLRDLFIVANEKTPSFYNEAPISDAQWKDIRRNSPTLRVHCYFSCTHEWADKDVIFKPSMPLASLVYKRNVWQRYPFLIYHFMSAYCETLEEFVDYSLSEGTYEQDYGKTFLPRMDNLVITVARNCQKLKWLTVKEPLSSASLILIACLNRNIRRFLVRDDMIIYTNDIPDDAFPDEVIKQTVNLFHETPEKLNEKMSEILNTIWRPLSRSNYFAILNNKYKKFK
ncbi:unnamed protein product [Mytilus coruscus]|uniref:F-box domain-containing protein n=1 Tax=Mytilus coruscus TaxID=42192 RepID=A0A6J8E6Y6_MYTCO|nr:unnamed protein product [Mytilus coruscus]